MKSLLYALLVLASLVVFACKQTSPNANPNNDATKKILTAEDSAYKDALSIHDEVMPKMGKLIGYQKKLQKQADSLAAIVNKKVEPAAKAFKLRADSLLFELKLAEKKMNDWMEGFNPEPELPTAEERIAYFEDQKAKAVKMKTQFFAALDKAKQMLGE